MNINYEATISHRPNQFVSWSISESGYLMSSGRTQTVAQARQSINEYVNDRNKYGHQITCTCTVVDLDADYESRVRALEAEGMTRSDAQAVADAQDLGGAA